MATRIFGTDGIRGRAGEGWLTTGAATSLGLALAEVLGAKDTHPHALLGHDGRKSGPGLEAALARGLRAGGFEVTTCGLITTPGLAWLVKDRRYALGAMVSASHNPAEDNGIKVFGASGEKLSDALEEAVEAQLRARPSLELAGEAPSHDAALEERYLSFLVEGAGKGLALHGLKLVLDCANGGASRVAPRVFFRLGAQVHAIAAEPDGENINRDCGATHLARLVREVRAHGAQLGIALDGDGDRCMLVDERGEVVHGDGILTIVARAAAQQGLWRDKRVVATVMSNRGLHKALREVGVGVVTTDVGDRRVVEALRREALLLGGEQSGHIVFGAEHDYIGDGIYTALRVLRILVQSGKPLSELAGAYRAFPQVLVNVPVPRKPALSSLARTLATQAKVESELGEDGRVLLRYSGTESLARVMVEGPDEALIRARAQELAETMVAEIGA